MEYARLHDRESDLRSHGVQKDFRLLCTSDDRCVHERTCANTKFLCVTTYGAAGICIIRVTLTRQNGYKGKMCGIAEV